MDGFAVVRQCLGERVKRPKCGAPSHYPLPIPAPRLRSGQAGNERPAVPSTRDSGVEPRRPGRWQRGKRRRRAYEVGWCGSCCAGLRGVWGCARHGALPYASHGEAARWMPPDHGWCGCAAPAMPTSKATTPHPSSTCSIGSTHGAYGTARVVPWQWAICSALPIAGPQRGRVRSRGRALRTCLQGMARDIGLGGALSDRVVQCAVEVDGSDVVVGARWQGSGGAQ